MDVIAALVTATIKLVSWAVRTTIFALWVAIRGIFQAIFSRKTSTFGTARWAKPDEIEQAGTYKNDGTGIIVGKYANRFLHFNGQGAVLTYAPMGSGKGAGIIIPNLLTYEGAVFVTDPKGENYAKTRRQRQALTNAPVYALNLQDLNRSDSFNPLDIIRTHTTHALDDAKALANLMVEYDPNEASHWANKAEEKLAAMMLYICETYHQRQPHLKTLSTLRRECNTGRLRLINFLEHMTRSDNSLIREEAHDLLSTLGAGEEVNNTGDEGASILSKITTATGIWSRDTGPGQISQKSDFNLLDVIDQNASVYVIVPMEKLNALKPFLRVMLGLSLYAVTRHHYERQKPQHQPLFVFDECAALGHMHALEQGMGYLREYAKAILVFQDLDQIKQTYKKAKSIINACTCHVAFAVNDMDTAKELSERIGQQTRVTTNRGNSQANTELLRRQHNAGQNEAGYALIDPSEIVRLPSDEALVFLGPGLGWPIKAKRIEYWKERRWKGLHDPWGNPAAPNIR